MQTLITCGTPWCELQPLQALLESAGLGKPRQAHAGSVLGIEQWHDRLCISQPALVSSIQPGKPWELAAGEIFLANWEQPVWGWADHRSTWLMEFWRDFDPSTRFVLLHTPAYDVLSRAMADTTSPAFDSQALLDTWCAYQTELLRFYHRNRTRCMLLHADQARQPGAPFVQAVNQLLGAALRPSEGAMPAVALTVDPLLHLLVQSLLQSHPEVRALEDEIRATLPEGQYPQPTGTVDMSAASLGLRELYGKEAERIKALTVQKLQIDVLAHENTQHITRLAAYQQEQDKLSVELKQETERLLLQLQQVQEELEQHFLSGQQLKGQLAQEATKSIASHAKLTSTVAELTAQRDAEAAAKSEAQTQRDVQTQAKAAAIGQRDALAQEKAALITAHESIIKTLTVQKSAYQQEQDKLSAELRQENELLLLQLQQVQEELEQHFLSGQQLKGQLAQEAAKSVAAHAQLTSTVAELTAQRDAEAAAKAEAQTQRDVQTQAKAAAIGQRDALAQEKAALVTAHEAEIRALVAQNRDAEVQQLKHLKQELARENELLLLQLHQVQEELEHYFLLHQQVTQEKQAVEARINKLLARYPEHAEWDRVEFLSNTLPLRSQIYGLRAGAANASMIDLSVELEDRTPVLVLTPPAKAADQPLRYWPAASQGGAEVSLARLQLNPSAPRNTEAAALLRLLAPSDLHLVRAACAAMLDGLPSDLQARDSWAEVIGVLRNQLGQLPPAWRFDNVTLKREECEPGDERLWFQLGNASYGSRHWPEFEFCLRAASFKPKRFSHLPIVEFPSQAGGVQQFENWFAACEDDRGPRFELRFDTKNKAMDMGLWSPLSATDQAQAVSMFEQLPALLLRLQHEGVQLSRFWSDWQGLVTGLQQTLRHSLGIEA